MKLFLVVVLIFSMCSFAIADECPDGSYPCQIPLDGEMIDTCCKNGLPIGVRGSIDSNMTLVAVVDQNCFNRHAGTCKDEGYMRELRCISSYGSWDTKRAKCLQKSEGKEEKCLDRAIKLCTKKRG